MFKALRLYLCGMSGMHCFCVCVSGYVCDRHKKTVHKIAGQFGHKEGVCRLQGYKMKGSKVAVGNSFCPF